MSPTSERGSTGGSLGRSPWRRELDAGGPDTLTHQEVAEMAAEAAGGVPLRFTRLWRAQCRASLRRFSGAGAHGRDAALYRLAESEVDVVAPAVGERRLGEYFAGWEVRGPAPLGEGT